MDPAVAEAQPPASAAAAAAAAAPTIASTAEDQRTDATKLNDVTDSFSALNAANNNTTAKGNGSKKAVRGTLNKQQISDLRAVLERTEDDHEARSVALRELYSASAKGGNELERRLAQVENKLKLTTDLLHQSSGTKDKLDELCRALRRQVKALTDSARESAHLHLSERKEFSEKFQTNVDDVLVKLHAQAEDSKNVLEENTDLREKLQKFLTHYDATEQHNKAQLHAKDLELQLAVAKEKQSAAELQLQKEKTVQTEKLLLEENEKLRTGTQDMLGRFAQVEVSLKKSSEVYSAQAEQIDLMRQVKNKFEKQNTELMIKSRKSDIHLIEQEQKIQSARNERDVLNVKFNKLSNLCRTLQQQRNQQDERMAQLEARRVSNQHEDVKDVTLRDEEVESAEEGTIEVVAATASQGGILVEGTEEKISNVAEEEEKLVKEVSV